MRKTKMEKGITLIALVITIVVLLILAMVTIKSITNDGILGKAQNAAKTYNEAVQNEQSVLDSYVGYLSGWQQNGTTVTKVSSGGETVTLEVGQTVTGYTSPAGTTDPGWAVLGAENGNLLLVSKVNVGSLTLKEKDGIDNGVTEMNKICVKYLNSTLAEEARSIKKADLDRVDGLTDSGSKAYEVLRSNAGADVGEYWLADYYKNSSSNYEGFYAVNTDGIFERAVYVEWGNTETMPAATTFGVRAVVKVSRLVTVSASSTGVVLGN